MLCACFRVEDDCPVEEGQNVAWKTELGLTWPAPVVGVL